MWKFLKQILGAVFPGLKSAASGAASSVGSALGSGLAGAATARILAGREGYESWLNSQTGAHLTGAENEANSFMATEAQKQRDFEAEMSNTSFQRAVSDMRLAGVNPALAMSQGGASTPSGAAATSVSPGETASMSDLMQLLMLGPQKKLMQQQGQAAIMQGEAALENAKSNSRNADTREKELEVSRALMQNTIRIGDSAIMLNEATANKIAQDIAESQSRVSLQQLEGICKELDISFAIDTYGDRVDLIRQQILCAVAERSNLAQLTKYYYELTENAQKQGIILGDEQVAADLGAEWRKNNPGWAKFLDQAGIVTSAIGNIVHFGASVNVGRSKSQSDVQVKSSSNNVSHTYTHKGE